MEFVSAVIVGSGSSSSTPSLHCVVKEQPCKSCVAAMQDIRNPNHRLNPCFLLQLHHPQDHTLHNVVIDCGKTFREAALKIFPSLHVRDISALLITHDHADACFGADDLREFVRDDTANGLDVYADDRTLTTMRRVFSYLFPKEGAATVDKRNYRQSGTNWTATIEWHRMQPLVRTEIAIPARVAGCSTQHEAGKASNNSNSNHPANTATWPFVAIPVLHGPNYHSNGFLFRLDHGCVTPHTTTTSTTPGNIPPITMNNTSHTPRLLLYVSDISKADEAFYRDVDRAKRAMLTEQELKALHGQSIPLEVLLLDMLATNTYISHVSVDESVQIATTLDAQRTYFIGFSHSLEHEAVKEMLRQRGVSDRMQPGYDGCVVAHRDRFVPGPEG